MNVYEFVEFYSVIGKCTGNVDAIIYEIYASCTKEDAPYFAALITGDISCNEQLECKNERATTLADLYDILSARRECANGSCVCLDEYTRRVFISPMKQRSWPLPRTLYIIELWQLVGSIIPCPLTIIPNSPISSTTAGRLIQLHWYESTIKLLTPDGNTIDGHLKAKMVASNTLANISCAILNCKLVDESIKAFDVIYMDGDFRASSINKRAKQLNRVKELAAPVFIGNIRDAIDYFKTFDLLCFDDNFVFSYNLVTCPINHV